MRPENVNGYTFPNALTSFTEEERSKDHFTVFILSLVIFITSDETTCQSANCHQPSLKTFDIFLHCGILSSGSVNCECCSVCGAVDLIDAFKSGTTHMLQRSFVYGESSRNANHTMESYFLGGRGRGK